MSEGLEVSRTGDLLKVGLVVGAVAALHLARDHRRTPFDAVFDAAGARRGVDPNLLRAIARHESGFKAGAINDRNDPGEGRDLGLMQVNERTARAMGRDVGKLLDPAYNVDTAAELLVRLKRELGPLDSLAARVAAYNAGSPAIKRRGIFNAAYTQAVLWHHQLYSLGRLLP